MKLDFEKILSEILPIGFYYGLNENSLNTIAIKTKLQYLNVIKLEIHRNNKHLIEVIINSNSNEITNKLNVFFNDFKLRAKSNPLFIDKWLFNTEKIISQNASELTPEQINAFDSWIERLMNRDLQVKNSLISSELIGRRYKDNNPNTKSIVTSHIENVLYRYNLTIDEAIKILLNTIGNYSNEWNKNVIPEILKNLKERKDIDLQSQQVKNVTSNTVKTKETQSIESKEPTLKQLAMYHVYLGTKMNNDNATSYLEGTSHTSGGKLKQHFDHYYLPKHRIYSGTDRPNFRRKLFAKVILMLKETNNLDAVLKAENELIQFEKNIA
jgi:antitoxin component of RelBE/YafQ-DinJ toxin-antitoxin module